MRPLAIMVLGCLAVSCAATRDVPEVHQALAFDRFGAPTDPTGNTRCQAKDGFCSGGFRTGKRSRKLGTEDGGLYERQIDRIFEELEGSNRKNILIFIHGGLNSRKGALVRAAGLSKKILEETDDTFPLFINWRSSLRSSYKDHVLFLRQGKIHKDGYVLLSPFYFLADVFRGIARAPVVWSHAIKNTHRARKSSSQGSKTRAQAERLSLNPDLFWESDPFGAEPCPDGKPSLGSRIGRGASLGVTLPTTKLLTAPFLDALGTSSWKVMLRRTDSLFTRDAFFRREFSPVWEKEEKRAGRPGVPQLDGGLAVFLRRLSNQVEGKHYRITIVGHSMGAIIANRIVEDFGDDLPIRNLVFMAAATSLEDYRDQVVPYVAARSETDPPVDVFHLTLSRKSEVRQLMAADLPPRGSLLVWLDDFLTEPRTAEGRMSGRMNTLMRAALAPGDSDARQHIHMKAYGPRCHRQTDPQKHGHFSSNFRFWEPQCWEPSMKNQALADGRQCFLPKRLY